MAQLSDWHENRTLWHATDLMGAAFAHGSQEVATEAAEFVLESGNLASNAARDLAQRILSKSTEADVPSNEVAEDLRRSVHRLRRQLVHYPHNAVRWVDLALEHTVLGNVEPAERAMRIALSLCPEDRFVLRAASRFYVHRDELDKAHGVLMKATSTRHDPWLVAAEIASASAANLKPKHVKLGRLMIDDRNFHPRQISELASAIGTLEFESGGRRKAKKSFSTALKDPTENSVAQAEWAFNNEGTWIENVDTKHVHRLFEAQAWAKLFTGDWAESLRQSLDWLRDQPFSAKPAELASYVAGSVLEDHALAIEILKQSLKPNPTNATILNNLAFSYANQDKLELASARLSEIDESGLDEGERIFVTATKGLLFFRQGNVDEGRAMYERAIRLAAAPEKVRYRISASINLALEEIRAQTEDSLKAYRFAAEVSEGVQDADIQLMLKRLHTRVEKNVNTV